MRGTKGCAEPSGVRGVRVSHDGQHARQMANGPRGTRGVRWGGGRWWGPGDLMILTAGDRRRPVRERLTHRGRRATQVIWSQSARHVVRDRVFPRQHRRRPEIDRVRSFSPGKGFGPVEWQMVGRRFCVSTQRHEIISTH